MKRCLLCLVLGGLVMVPILGAADRPAKPRVFELRTYTTHEGRLDALHARFRDHTCKLFKKHNMQMIGFWMPTDEEKAENTLVYLLAFESRDAAKKAWSAFRNDPVWRAASKASIADGRIVRKVESEFLSATDYSAMK